jgi:FAD synthase
VLVLDFVARLRDERAYPTLNALVAQLREDIAQTRALLDEEGHGTS